MTLPDKRSLQPWLTTHWLGHAVESYSSINSTNIRAKERAYDQDAQGLLVVADSQTAGRGRMTRVWHSPPGRNLYFSFVLKPTAPPETIPQIAILTAIALHQAISQTLPEHAFGLKWPNDIWSSTGKKLSGILCEATFQGKKAAIIVGVGINVNDDIANFPPELQKTAGTLLDIAGHRLDRAKLLADFLNAFEPLFEIWEISASLQPFLQYWNDFDILRGNHIQLSVNGSDTEGIVQELMPDGRLLLKHDDGTLDYIHAGDTHLKHN